MAPGRGGGVGRLNSDGVQRLHLFISVLVSYVHVHSCSLAMAYRYETMIALQVARRLFVSAACHIPLRTVFSLDERFEITG
jgi:hypothetical protein